MSKPGGETALGQGFKPKPGLNNPWTGLDQYEMEKKMKKRGSPIVPNQKSKHPQQAASSQNNQP